ncbi:AraC family transcriptional regulator [Gimesia maris]|uniref:Xylose operon regulatory protein n=1 Tax=Gimesia maris TaxID=122 RepID=A0ABX5YK89_9PLAN|nr:XylR family transcriptional regulator [Gimesia maris]EDL57463.1 xylose operon regulatory protein [Gimesia maris DSM 8797]QDT78544.1 Xylose operon regulatory protein [Gimesia maris]QEG16131.1 Xylose operon regulatory protein [Gimesia maris]QGQ30629.1 XylR family transcriptional regulator [Gimesia maris]
MNIFRWRVALLVQTSSEWSRQVLEGVAEYAASNGGWDFRIEPRGFYEKLRLPLTWEGDGVICRLTDPELIEELHSRNIPAVNVSWKGLNSNDIPNVISDEAACGRLAADYFIQNGWTNFGFVGPPPNQKYTDVTQKSYSQLLAAGGYHTYQFEHSLGYGKLSFEDQRPEMEKWLLSLPKPIALFVWTTTMGQEIMLFCRHLGLSVPNDVAILAVELDPLISSLSPVPIAYIDQSPHRVGMEAAKLLQKMIQGEPAPEKSVLIPPSGIVARQSVDTLLGEDEHVRNAIEFIRKKIALPMQVEDVANAVSLSRRSLENRFQKTLGKSPAQMIRESKLSRAMNLLMETNLTIQEIAERTGFFHVETFARFFKRETGKPPSLYRDKKPLVASLNDGTEI